MKRNWFFRIAMLWVLWKLIAPETPLVEVTINLPPRVIGEVN